MFEDPIIQSFGNREAALYLWIFIIFLLLIFKKEIRSSTLNVLKILTSRKLLFITILVILYVTLEIYFLSSLNLWNTSYLLPTISWFFIAAIPLLYKMSIDKKFSFIKEIKSMVGITVIFGALVNTHNFPFIAEFILIPIIAIFTLPLVLPENKGKILPLKKMCDSILLIIGVAIAAWSIYNFIANPSSLTTSLRGFISITLLGILFIPSAYIIALYVKYEKIFTYIDIFLNNDKDRRSLKRKMIMENKLNLKKLDKISGAYIVERIRKDGL